ncbi:ribosome biogenesis factor YjgA [Halomonas saccharevitans]|uniref:Dual-action ribosomal maturation protein DarP n=1 Tax=Halomonas saccharevitans TaxID=416872 RepID=A0A1I6X1W0_9GAMM|nr:ribosome biogenesis factor YjgA [Halomonas saccharevitans]MDT8880360.1 ribosome biogenesis factor YjgA [Halomonas saccharevitans]SFT32303.1 ribosome-associated protein [Halomonas saccharevitans]
MTQDDLSPADERPSKSQLKREMQSLQQLGEQIIAMSDAQRARFPLSDDLLAAVEETGRIKAREARRRHMQYVGKVMRGEDLDAIQAVFDEIENETLRRDHAFHRLEKWRDRLIEEGDDAVEAFVVEFPDAERQALRQLIRNARRERDQGKPPTSARRLFKLIRDGAGL